MGQNTLGCRVIICQDGHILMVTVINLAKLDCGRDQSSTVMVGRGKIVRNRDSVAESCVGHDVKRNTFLDYS